MESIIMYFCYIMDAPQSNIYILVIEMVYHKDIFILALFLL